jgi:hypothetical protein
MLRSIAPSSTGVASHLCLSSADFITIIAESNFRYRQGHCAGRPMRGINVIYLPRSGFTGVDVVQYTVKFTVISQTVDVDISVQSDQATRGNVGVPPSSEDDPQTQGPIPICVPPGLLGKQRCVASLRFCHAPGPPSIGDFSRSQGLTSIPPSSGRVERIRRARAFRRYRLKSPPINCCGAICHGFC